MADYPRLLNAQEVADLCRVKPSTLAAWRVQNTGPRCARLGRRVVYREDDVLAWIEAQFAAANGPSVA